MKCPNCGTEAPEYLRDCPACSEDLGFPNVRAASRDDEAVALDKRVEDARISLDARGCIDASEDFEAAADSSSVVWARDLATLDSMVKSSNILYINFQQQVRSGARIAASNSWDPGRDAAESTVSPGYYDQICYAALSLDGIGVTAYGSYSITLKNQMVANRTTVFEENPFVFCERHRIIAGRPCPKGYRAVWARRGKLALAKLHGRIQQNATADEYARVLLDQGSGTGDADFIEAHIFGPIQSAAIERVVGPKPKNRADQVIWKSVKTALNRLGASVVEI